MSVTAILYLKALTRSISFRPYLARIDSRPILGMLAERILSNPSVDRLLILYHYESEREVLERAIAGTKAELRPTTHFSEIHAITDAAVEVSAEQVAVLHLGAAIAPSALLLRVLQHHNEYKNSFTLVADLPEICSISIFNVSTLVNLDKLSDVFGFYAPEDAIRRLLALGEQAKGRFTDLQRCVPFDFCVSYSIPRGNLPNVISLWQENDFLLADEAIHRAKTEQLDLRSTGILLAFKQVDTEKRSSECLLPQPCLVPARPKKSDKIHVLFISLPSAFSGAEQALCSMIKFIDQKHFQMSAITVRKGVFADKLRALGVHAIAPEKEVMAQNVESFCFAMKLYQELQPDILHFNGRGTLPFLSAATACNIPVVQHVRNGDMSGFEDGLALSKSIISISEFLKAETLRYPVDEKKITVIYDEVDTDHYDPALFSQSECRKEIGLQKEDRVALMIARIAPNKRQDLMLQAAAQIRQQIPNFKLVLKGDVYGESHQHRQIKQMVHNLHLEDAIVWLDFVPDIRRLIATADTLVLCSDREGLGSCVVEAMSMAVPVVVTNTGGTHEIVESGRSGGFVIPGNDAEQLAARVIELLSDEELRQQLGQNGREFIRRHLDARISARSVMDIYEQLCPLAASTHSV
jgi:glycosyltransferase involved in cell wall biosynthesis